MAENQRVLSAEEAQQVDQMQVSNILGAKVIEKYEGQLGKLMTQIFQSEAKHEMFVQTIQDLEQQLAEARAQLAEYEDEDEEVEVPQKPVAVNREQRRKQARKSN